MHKEELEEGEIELDEVQPVTFKPPLPPMPPPQPPRPISPPPELPIPRTESSSNDVLSKPIKRREVLEEEQGEERDERTNVEDSDVYANFSPNRNVKDFEREARNDLISFLQKKSLDASWADYYSINVRPQKKRKDPNRKSEGLGYSVTYTNPEGTFLASKGDVLSDIQDRMKKSSLRNALGSSARTAAFEEAAHKVKNLILPFWLDNIYLLELGKIDTRSGFHSSVYIYPIGYKCEQTVIGTTLHKGVTEQDIICEIGDLDGFPEFRITVKSTGTVFCGFSEAAVWRKFNPGNVDVDWNPSFFNLQVELLIEGLEGSLQCEEYKFHIERGYNQTYFTEENAKIARKDFLTKAARERRNQDRQKNKHLSKEQQERQLELQRRTLEEEKEFSKKLKVVEKERKDRGKEEAIKKKEEKKVTEAKRREEAKQQEIQSKEKLRAAERQHREQIKKNEKAKQQLRKDIFNEIRKNRSDANSSVLQFFDNEEENILQSENESHLYNDSNHGISSKEDGNLSNDADLRGFILNQDPLPDIPDQPNALLESTVSLFSKGSRFHSGLSWDDIFYIANTVFLLKPMLGLGRGLNFDELLTGLEILVSPNSSFPSVETKDDTAMDIEQEFDSGSSSKSSTFLQRKALIEIEKLELFITKILLRDLSTLLDLDQREAADKRQAIPQTLYFPLNQMTWMEIVRMSLLNYLYTQFERSKDDIQHALRGSKQPSYRIAKNIVRNIRYRWYLRHKLHPTKRVKEIFDPSSLLARLVDSKKSTDEAKGGEAKAVIYIQPEDRLSIMQGIQYLATARTDEGGSADLLEFSLYTKALNELNTERKLSRPLQNIFNSEEEIDYELKKMANDATQSDIYRRCCKVMIRVLSLNASKNFLWEIDQEMYPDYYSIIIRPLMFANVATNVITKAYETNNATDERVAYYHIANEFLQDLRQVCLNCIVFSTELPLVVAQAQKLLLTIHRLVDRWIFSTSRPELAECDEGFCLLTNYPLQGNNRGEMIKCGKCQGTFSLTGLDEVLTLDSSADEVMAKQFTDFYIPPTTEVLSQVNEEWHCPLCLREDFIFTQSLYLQQREGNEGDAIAAVLSLSKNGAHTVDEWGPCGLIPWYFDTNHCNGVNEMTKKQPHLLPVIDALKVLSQSSVIPTTGNIANTAINSSIASSSTWTVAERIKLLSALCTVIHSTSKVTTYMSKLHNDSEKLLKLCANKHFREGDFFATVKSICGEDDAMYCRSRLDSMMSNMNTGSSHFSPTEVISESFRLQNMVTEGRCLVCNVTTFDDEIAFEEGEDNENPQGSKVILCDGCNAEAHLKCLNLTTVPSNAWYCSRCSERQAKISKSDTSNAFDNIDSFRDKEEEDGLIDLCANEKVNGKDPFTANQDEIQCIYCGMNEREICSPLVIGQTRTEHDAWIEMYGKERQLVADNFYRVNGQSQKNTVVNFLFAEKTITPPKLTPPYYPPLQTAEGKTLMNYYENIQQTPIVAHQLCCLQLFQARLNRSRHALRRRRKDVASLALLKSGISTQSLGKDHYGYEYWKFPFTLDLFITHFNVDGSSAMVVLDPDREEFNRLIGKVTTSSSASQGTRKKWYRIGNSDGIRSIVELLDDSREAERTLKQNLIQFLLNERILIEKKPTLTKVDSHGTYDGGSLMDVAESKDGESGDHAEPIGNDSSEIKESYSTGKPGRKSLESSSTANTPVSIRLFPNKGQELVTFYSIPEEKVFDDSLPTDDTEEAGNEGDDPDSDNYHQYFSFSTKKYFAIGLVNSSEGLVKVANFNNDYKVVYQIHREGISQPISYAYLSEAWSDHFYYFATINFKRSGKYTISFLLEGGTNAGSIKPLIYSVTVEAKSVKSGIPNALDHLSASQYLDSNSRQIVSSKRELHQYLRNLQITLSSITIASKYQTNDAAMAVAIKILLIKVFLALPQGSLSSETTYASSFSVDEASDELLSSHLLEPSSWNYLLEHAWKDALVKAQCPTALMECLLLLEFYINRSWYSNYYSRLLNALPNPHFAIRTCTYASVALRVFCLDRAILYDKIQTAPRERRSTGNSNNHSNDYETRESYSGRGENTRSSRYAQRKQQEGTPPQASGGRSRRNAAVAASAKLKDIDSDAEEGAQKRISRQASEDSNYRQNDDDEDASDSGEEDEDDSNLVDEEEEEEEEERKGSSTRADGWKCKFCATKNEARARSCVSCGEKKPIPGVSNRERGGKTRGKKRKVSGKASGGRGRKKRRMSKRSSYSDEEDEEEAEEDDGSDDDDDEDNPDDEDNYKKPQRQTRASTVARTRGRGRPPKSYSEDSDEVEEEVEGESDEDEYKYRKQSKKRKSNDEDEEEEDEQAESEDDDEEEKDDEGEEEEDGENGDAQNNNHEDFIDQKTQAIETKISEWKASPSLQNDMNIRFASILRQYLTNESFEVFWYPVNTELEPSYSSYIKEPMDLGTILQKVFNNAYATDVEKFRYDINLVWSNCMTYNLESSELYSLAEEAVNTTEDFINRWITSSEHPEDPDIQE